MVSSSLTSRRRAIVSCVVATFTALTCAALLGAAALVPAPPGVLPVIILACVGCPMLAATALPDSIAALRARRLTRSGAAPPLDRRALKKLRGELDRLPETRHPFGL